MSVYPILTAEALRLALSYCAETGQFRRLAANRYRPDTAGRVVGDVCTSGHIQICVDGRYYLAHRLAFLWMTGLWPDDDVDHINRVPSDNRWSNLRAATRGANCTNRTSFGRKFDLPRGVTPAGRRFKAQIRVNGETVYLGRFDTPDAAHRAFIAAATPIRGEFLPR